MSCRKPSGAGKRDGDRETKKEGEVRDAIEELDNRSLNRITSVCWNLWSPCRDLFLLCRVKDGTFLWIALTVSRDPKASPSHSSSPGPFLNSSWVVMACWMYHTYHSHGALCHAPSSHPRAPSSMLGSKDSSKFWFTYIYVLSLWSVMYLLRSFKISLQYF